LGQLVFGGIEKGLKIVAAGAGEIVGKAERFLRSFFQAPGVKSATFSCGFPQVRIFHSASRPAIFGFH
jgi:hypothetical protein